MVEIGGLLNQESSPLVSVGIPTYDRPQGLRRTLGCITYQSYKNLEIIVSDNCSQGTETEQVVREFMRDDPRVKYYRQNENKGPLANFRFVLEMASGKYFMWAADDDMWVSTFIEQLVYLLEQQGKDCVAAMMEAQYIDDNSHLFEFFSEGKPFYDFCSDNTYNRLTHMLNYNYGNLFYSIFHKSILFDSGKCFFESVDLKSSNEIPLLLYVIQKGNWIVLPNIGLYKKTNIKTYEQAKWEKLGGNLPNSNGLSYFKTLPSNFEYHLLARHDIFKTLDVLKLKRLEKFKHKVISSSLLLKHFLSLVIRNKRRVY